MEDKDLALKKKAGIDSLNQDTNYLEILTLSELMRLDFNEVLKQNDNLCTKLLLVNLKKGNFEHKFHELKAEQIKSKR